MPDFDANSPDGMLIAAALAEHEDAFAQLVARYQGPLLRAAMSRLARREWAEEAVQETFLCAHRWLATYDSAFSFRTWLWTILLNQCTRHVKREARHAAASSAPNNSGAIDACFGSEDAPLDQLLARETSEKVHELLSRLPEAQADALRLRFFGGLTFPEIAVAMKCSEPGAKNRVKSGLVKLGEWLKRTSRASEAREADESGESCGESL